MTQVQQDKIMVKYSKTNVLTRFITPFAIITRSVATPNLSVSIFYKDQWAEKYTHKRISPFVKQVWVRKVDFISQLIPHVAQGKNGYRELVEDREIGLDNLNIQD